MESDKSDPRVGLIFQVAVLAIGTLIAGCPVTLNGMVCIGDAEDSASGAASKQGWYWNGTATVLYTGHCRVAVPEQ